MKKATDTNIEWYHKRSWATVISLLSFVGCYIVASLAIDSGSLMQYFIAIVLLVLAINRLVHIAIVTVKKTPA